MLFRLWCLWCVVHTLEKRWSKIISALSFLRYLPLSLFIFRRHMVVVNNSRIKYTALTAWRCVAAVVLVIGSIDKCQAWTTSNNYNSVRIPRNGGGNSGLLTTTSAPAVAAPGANTAPSHDINVMTQQRRYNVLQSALEHARKIDQRYGLCTPESTYAWSIVDELYLSMPEYSSPVEDSVRKAFPKQKSVWDVVAWLLLLLLLHGIRIDPVFVCKQFLDVCGRVTIKQQVSTATSKRKQPKKWEILLERMKINNVY